jgi:hypothetical protein
MMNQNTFREIVDLLTPLMENLTSRQSLVYSALLNEPIAKQVDFSSTTDDFVIALVKKLDAYGTISTGELALVALLNAAKERVGFDKRQQIDRLIGTLAQPTHYQKPAVANEKHKRSLLETLLTNQIWTGISGIVTILALIIAYMALPSQNQATPTPIPPSATLALTTIEPTATMTDTATNTPQPTATDTATATNTPIPTPTHLAIAIAMDTPIPTFTDVPTATITPIPPSPIANISISPTRAVLERAYPCNAEIVFNSTALLNVVRGGPSSRSSYRNPIQQGLDIIILSRVEENRDTFWYQIADIDSNELGWITPAYVVLSDSCPEQ